ncbi:MAG: type VI secretion protein IcmF/TssM N-terminal domain-containing protein, partial [Thermodesulfobacteriota bacterium]
MKILITALKILLALILLAVLALGLYWLVQRQGWPWWAGAAIAFGLFGLIVGFLFLKKWLFRRREERFVKRIVEMDETVAPKVPVAERQALRDLEERWREAVEVLRRSLLKKRGHPLYVLPWYLILGESGSGKTEAIKSSGLLSPLTDVSPLPQGGGTRNCDWWFFHKAVVIDTVGRYALPVDEVADTEEWERFLKLLAKNRRREPLNGLLLAVAADKLMTAGDETLVENARVLRRRVDELMRILGAKFPVYLIVTKADKLFGLTEYGNLLPEEVRRQVLGHSDTTGRHDPERFLDETVAKVTERLKDVRLMFLHQSRGAPRPGLLIFPDELERLKPRLAQFLGTLFEENPYQETPLLRGLYFTSARQEGQVGSQYFQGLAALKAHLENLPGTAAGLFLHDLFDRVLPSDRYLFTPVKEYLSWRRMTQSLGVTAWAALLICLCGLLTLSYLKNMETLNTIIHQMPAPPTLTSALGKDILIMGGFRARLKEMEELNRRWWVPRLGLDQSLDVERTLKNRYCRMFRQGFLEQLDKSLMREIGGFSAQTEGEIIGAFVEHLETRINLLIAELKGKSLSDLEKMPQPSYSAMVVVDQRLIPEIAAEFSTLYLSYLEWNRDRTILQQELSSLRAWLKHVAGVRGTNLNWLINWANVRPDLQPVTLEQFWGSYRPTGEDDARVPPAYTLSGRQQIDDFLARYSVSLEEPQMLEPMVADFNLWYWRQFIQAWTDFGQSFVEGYLRLQSEDDMRVLAQMMADPKNPYFELLDLMATQLKPLQTMEGRPDWIDVAVDFPRIKQQAAQEKLMQSAGIVTKAAEKGKAVLEKAAKAGEVDQAAMESLEQTIKAAEQFRTYEEALAAIIPVTSSRQKAFEMAASLYHVGDAKDTEQESPFRKAYSAFVGLRGTIKQHSQRDNVFWMLFSGPLYFLLAYATHEAGCELQNEWEGTVLAEIAEMPDVKIRDALFKENEGLVWKFINGPARPFLTRDLQGFYPRTTLNQPFPFERPFLDFLNEGASQTAQLLPEYTVSMKARPVNVNPGAILEPYGVVLTLDCQDGNQQLENYNYPASLDFKWQPDKCGDV